MLTIILLAVQAASPPPTAKSDCPPQKDDSEVVVCAKASQEEFRLHPLPSRFEKPKTGPGLEFDLGGGVKSNIYSTGETSPDGKPDKRIMVKFRIPF